MAGKPLFVRHTNKRFHLNMLSAISAKGELRFMTSREAALGGAVRVNSLPPVDHQLSKKDLSRRRRIARTRPSRLLASVHQVKDRLRLYNNPPYSPEVNPDELAWNDVKDHGVARTLIHAPDLHRAVGSRVAGCCKKIQAKFALSSRWKRRVMQPLSS